MSSVTSSWIIVPEGYDPTAGDSIESVAKFVHDFIRDDRGWPPNGNTYPTISLDRDDWPGLQGGSKVADMAGVWFGWNHANVDGLIKALEGFAPAHNALLIWQHENDEDLSFHKIEVASW